MTFVKDVYEVIDEVNCVVLKGKEIGEEEQFRGIYT